ncbi:hypothetical protein BC826DRAFT_1187460 [Russula brevipes]|nr:hypothetical protein BC826DRAFT_1187460 [Russula brevipes]
MSNRRHQTIGPFKNFTFIIGPNGAEMSNFVDIIPFVPGAKSAQLRSSQLRDLVYRGRRLARDNGEGTSQPDQEDEEEDESQATFIRLDTIQVKPINDKLRTFARADVIQYEPAMERAIHHACGNALVCDTIEVARFVCYEKDQDVKGTPPLHLYGSTDEMTGTAVTLEGTIIHKSGLITGGRSTHENGKKWAEKDIQGLSRHEGQYPGQLNELIKQKPRNKVGDSLTSEMTRLEATLQVSRDDLSACNHDSHEVHSINFAGKSISVANIRDCESRQLKLAQEASEARLRFETQIARLTNLLRTTAIEAPGAPEHPVETVTRKRSLKNLEERKTETEDEFESTQEGIKELEAEVSRIKATLDEKEKTKLVDEAKRQNDDTEWLGLERSGLYRKCRLEEIKLPSVSGNLKNVPMEENLRDEVAMDVDEEDEEGFEILSADERENASGEVLGEFDASIAKLNSEIKRMTPNMKAMDRHVCSLDDVESKLTETEKEAEKARKDAKDARDPFNDVKRRRYGSISRILAMSLILKIMHNTELFNQAYNPISERIDQVYKDLTKGKVAPMGGVAYLSLVEDNEYHAMPPMKRFLDMEQLSGGEKTVVALVLLFAIHGSAAALGSPRAIGD